MCSVTHVTLVTDATDVYTGRYALRTAAIALPPSLTQVMTVFEYKYHITHQRK